jgi:hypothetical protein
MAGLATLLVACHAPTKPAPGQEGAAALTRQGLLLSRKIFQAVRRQLHAAADEDSQSVVDDIVQLFGREDAAFDELEEAVTNDRVVAY